MVKFDAHLSSEDLGHAPSGSIHHRRSVDLESSDGPRPLRASNRYIYISVECACVEIRKLLINNCTVKLTSVHDN